jgi:hypothetical protein
MNPEPRACLCSNVIGCCQRLLPIERNRLCMTAEENSYARYYFTYSQQNLNTSTHLPIWIRLNFDFAYLLTALLNPNIIMNNKLEKITKLKMHKIRTVSIKMILANKFRI